MIILLKWLGSLLDLFVNYLIIAHFDKLSNFINSFTALLWMHLLPGDKQPSQTINVSFKFRK